MTEKNIINSTSDKKKSSKIARYNMRTELPERKFQDFAEKSMKRIYKDFELSDCPNFTHIGTRQSHILSPETQKSQAGLYGLKTRLEIKCDEENEIVYYEPTSNNPVYSYYGREDTAIKSANLTRLLKEENSALNMYQMPNPENPQEYLTVFSTEEPPEKLFKPSVPVKVRYTNQ